MTDGPVERQHQAMRETADAIARFREEWAERMRAQFVEELNDLIQSGADPLRGRGRGPAWAEGG